MASDVESLAREYVAMPQVQQMMEDMFSPSSMAAQMTAALPAHVQLTDEQVQKIGTIMSKNMIELKPKLEEIMYRSSIATFDAEELRALIDFYSSETGASVMAKMQPFMQTTMTELAPEIQSVQQKIVPEIAKILQEKN
ncbi:MAG: DUF2059 domain-containing protein [Shimia thalassica]